MDNYHLSNTKYPDDSWNILNQYLTNERKQKLECKSKLRSSFFRLAVQDPYHPHNISACLRSAEAFGIQNVDIISTRNYFRSTSVAKGVSDWLSIHTHDDIAKYSKDMKEQGYRLCAALPSDNATPLGKIPVDKPTVILFGNEKNGISEAWTEYIDETFTIPMVGFVESLNISVSAAITMQTLTEKAKTKNPSHYYLNSNQRKNLLNQWVCKTLPSWQKIYAHKKT